MKRKWLKFFAIGGIGGIAPNLLKFAFHPLTFFDEFTSTGDWLCWITSLVIFFSVGGVVAYITEKKSLMKAFYLGISAPSIILALYHVGFQEEQKINIKYEIIEIAYHTDYPSHLNSKKLYRESEQIHDSKSEDLGVYSKTNDFLLPLSNTLMLNAALPTNTSSSNSSYTHQIINVEAFSGDSIEYEEPFKEREGWRKVEPDKRVEMYTKTVDVLSPIPNTVILNLALVKHVLNNYTFLVNFVIENDSTYESVQTITLYREKRGKTEYSNIVEIPLREVVTGTYNCMISIAHVDTSDTDRSFALLGTIIKFDEEESVNIVCILNPEIGKTYAHKAKNLSVADAMDWVGDLAEKHSKKSNPITRFFQRIFKFFF